MIGLSTRLTGVFVPIEIPSNRFPLASPFSRTPRRDTREAFRSPCVHSRTGILRWCGMLPLFVSKGQLVPPGVIVLSSNASPSNAAWLALAVAAATLLGLLLLILMYVFSNGFFGMLNDAVI